MVSSEYIRITIPEDPANPHRLGRKVNHDPRSADYGYEPRRAVAIVDRPAWPSTLDILDQARLGSCVPNTGVESLATDYATRPALSTADMMRPGGSEAINLTDPLEAEGWITNPNTGLYHLVTNADPFDGGYTPDDTGSDGTSLGNLFLELGLIESFSHAFNGLADVLAFLSTEGPAWMGSDWYDSMFDPSSDGEVTISPNATVAGGHQYLLTGRIDAARRLVEMRNHWRNSWGMNGRAWMSYSLIERLLGQNGDAQLIKPKVAVVPPFVPTPERPGCLAQFVPASMQRRLGRN